MRLVNPETIDLVIEHAHKARTNEPKMYAYELAKQRAEREARAKGDTKPVDVGSVPMFKWLVEEPENRVMADFVLGGSHGR